MRVGTGWENEILMGIWEATTENLSGGDGSICNDGLKGYYISESRPGRLHRDTAAWPHSLLIPIYLIHLLSALLASWAFQLSKTPCQVPFVSPPKWSIIKVQTHAHDRKWRYKAYAIGN